MVCFKIFSQKRKLMPHKGRKEEKKEKSVFLLQQVRQEIRIGCIRRLFRLLRSLVESLTLNPC